MACLVVFVFVAHVLAVQSKEAPYYQQPALTALPSLPKTARLSASDKVEADSISLHDSRHSDPFNLSKPSTFDPDSLLPQPATNDTNNQHPQLDRSTTDDTIRTTRHVRPSPVGSLHKQNLVPLPLGPIVLRDPRDVTPTITPSPANWESTNAKRRHQRSESTQDLLSNASRQPYLHHRETPYQRCSRRSTETLTMRMSPPENTMQSFLAQRSLAPQTTASTPSLSSSYKQHARDASSSSTQSTLNERPWTGTRLVRKRSNQSKASLGSPGDSDVEKEVLELNTIVEERRAEGNKHRSRNSHIPAVAPSMQVGARSETLDDIGSALSRPLTTRHAAYLTKTGSEVDSNQRPKSSRSTAHVSGWLSSVTTTSDEPFYKYAAEPQSRSRATSASSSVTALDSVSYTLESSPTTSKRYSRSLMITPLAPVDDCVDDAIRERQIGVAM